MSAPLSLEDRADAYVLGLMDDTDRRAFEATLEGDVTLQQAVGQARDRYLELDLAGPEAALSPDLWSRIEERLSGSPPAEAPAPAPVKRPANDNRLSRWRGLALSASAATLLLAVGLAASLLGRPEPEVVAILMNETGEPVVLIEDFGNDAARVTPLVDVAVPADRSLQLWTLPTKEMGPVSMGVLAGWRTATVDGPHLPEPKEAQLYEITLEPLGGSPSGRPTGPILGKGFAKTPRH